MEANGEGGRRDRNSATFFLRCLLFPEPQPLPTPPKAPNCWVSSPCGSPGSVACPTPRCCWTTLPALTC